MGAPGGVQIPGHQRGVPPPPQQHPSKRSKCRQLFRSPSMPSSVIRPILKRIERPHSHDTPIKSKRRRSLAGTPGEATEPVGDRDDEQGGGAESLRGAAEPHVGCRGGLWLQKTRLLRSRSFCQEEIENMLANDQRELIGDFSKVGMQGQRGGHGAFCPCRAGGGAAGRCWATSRHHKPYLRWWEQPLTPRTSCPADIPAADGGGQAPGPQVHLP